MQIVSQLAGTNTDDVRDSLGIPWQNNEEMIECLEDDRKRGQLTALSMDEKWEDAKDVWRFIKMCFTPDHKLHIHSEE